MPLPRVSLRSFLSSAKTALHNAHQQSSPLTFVIGNEAADLDSLCSALVLAYLRTYTSTSSTTNSNTLYIPLSNIPRADLSLRPELLPILSRANLAPTDLITLSDLPSLSQSTRLPPEKTKWILVDHNALLGELGTIYSSRVFGCIDHHDEEGKVPRDCGDEPRVVRKSGSCSSLVVEYCREAWDALSAKGSSSENDSETKKWDAELARVALGPVLIDTSNLENEAKTTDADVEAAKYLEELIAAGEGEGLDREGYYREIWRAEGDVQGMSLVDLLRKDYKQWSEGDVKLGVCSVVKDMDFLLSKSEGRDEFFNTLGAFSRERDLSICSIVTRFSATGGSDFQRELFVWGLDDRGVEALKKFEAESSERLGLEGWREGELDCVEGGMWRKCWRQMRIENSRKQIAPMLRSSMIG
ncbi:hypothetical protein BKA65DRAFT_452293 [Rhexocercosporidium sp. MPI-PUGE-AT-0058]|nr:hypothetical protein BKA65DRAFT_452293 [Rhexocercosporidium sp. MPI-PUGE-AT-0058]